MTHALHETLLIDRTFVFQRLLVAQRGSPFKWKAASCANRSCVMDHLAFRLQTLEQVPL